MPTQIALHQLEDLSHEESKNEIILQTELNTELRITVKNDITIITLPMGNKFDIIGSRIVIHST